MQLLGVTIIELPALDQVADIIDAQPRIIQSQQCFSIIEFDKPCSPASAVFWIDGKLLIEFPVLDAEKARSGP